MAGRDRVKTKPCSAEQRQRGGSRRRPPLWRQRRCRAASALLLLPLSPLSLGLGVRWMDTRWWRGTGTHLGNRGWGFYSRSSARHGKSGWGWPRGARRAVIASRLGLRGRDAAVGALAKPISRSLVNKAGDREATRSWLGHDHGRRARQRSCTVRDPIGQPVPAWHPSNGASWSVVRHGRRRGVEVASDLSPTASALCS